MSNSPGVDVNALAAELGSGDPGIRLAAAERLARLAEAAAPAAVALVTACGDADDLVREQIVAALEDLGAPPPDSIGRLVALVADREPLTAYWATTLLGRSGQDAAAAVPALTLRLESQADPAVRQRAAWALGKIGPAATAALEALRRAGGDGDARLARLASEAIESIGR